MDSNAMLMLGMVKMQNSVTKQVELVDVKGFDVLAFFFPIIRLIVAGMWSKVLLFCVTFWAYPVWSWYLGFNFKKMNFEGKLKAGWTIVEDKKLAA